jgi:hypothetical protein
LEFLKEVEELLRRIKKDREKRNVGGEEDSENSPYGRKSNFGRYTF